VEQIFQMSNSIFKENLKVIPQFCLFAPTYAHLHRYVLGHQSDQIVRIFAFLAIAFFLISVVGRQYVWATFSTEKVMQKYKNKMRYILANFFTNSSGHTVGHPYYVEYRVARFFLIQHTKTRKIYQMTTKYTKLRED
jgi:hypothetical protein